MKSWNRFNGFREIPVFLYKPLKRLITFRVTPNPKLKLGENEKLDGFCKRPQLIEHKASTKSNRENQLASTFP